ncbi:MAG: hypothetical protein P8Q97_17005 [Myxococcota bacterium]|nr:hypothetical protein [Myxococcota bacterium]
MHGTHRTDERIERIEMTERIEMQETRPVAGTGETGVSTRRALLEHPVGTQRSGGAMRGSWAESPEQVNLPLGPALPHTALLETEVAPDHALLESVAAFLAVMLVGLASAAFSPL